MHILAIEPDQTDRFLLKRLFSKQRYSITTLSSAREAFAFASSSAFDVALINKTLVNDLDCIAALKGLQKLNSSFVAYATTSHVRIDQHYILLAAGFEGVLKKPLTSLPVFHHNPAC